MAIVTKAQFRFGAIMAGLILVFLVYGHISRVYDYEQAQEDRNLLKEQLDEIQNNQSVIDTNQTELIRKVDYAINQSEEQRQNLMSSLVPALEVSFNQTAQIVELANETKSLTKFLSDNFGATSGYLEREDFQYKQANDTFNYLNQSLQNQEKIMKMLNST